MAQAPAFNSNGATPGLGQFSAYAPKKPLVDMKPTTTFTNLAAPKPKSAPLDYGALSKSINTGVGTQMSSIPKPVTPTPTTPLKKTIKTNLDGTSTTNEYHAEKTTPGVLPSSNQNKDTSTTQTTTPPVNTQVNDTPPPANLNYGGIIKGVYDASNNATQTGSDNVNRGVIPQQNVANDPQKVASGFNNTLSTISTGQTPEVKQAQEEYNKFAKASPLLLSNIANNPNVADIVASGRGQALGQTLSAEQQALQGNVNNALQGQNQQINAANAGAGNVNTAQNTGVTAGNNVLNAGLSGQSTGISGLGAAGNLNRPVNDIILRDPTTGAVIGDQNLNDLAKMKGNLSGLESGAASASGALGGAQANLTAKYEEGKAKIRAASNIEPQIVQTLNDNPGLNSIPISKINDLNRWFSGQTSQPEQQILSRQVASYIASLGLSPEEASQIAIQKGGTIGTLLKNIKDTAIATNEGNNPKNISGTGPTSKSTGNSSKAQFSPNGTLQAVSF